jgi:membrane protein YqaA with SNARE-associated domain
MNDLLVYGGLFAVAFLAATIFPAQSEAAFLGLLALDRYPELVLLAVASTGNVLGSSVNYALGSLLAGSAKLQRLVKPAHRERAEQWYRRYGKWSLLGSWIPIIGDPLTIVAGVLREPFGIFLLLVGIAKTGRYLLILLLHQAWIV